MRIEYEKSVISVVVPTRGRVNLLKNLFVSLKKASLNCNVPIETIIVDDSPLDQQNQIKKLCQEFEVRYFDGPSDVREKRNIGIREASGKIILFTDSDCEVSPNIFHEHLKVYAEDDTAGVLGITKFKGKENITWKIVSRTMFLDSFSFAETLSKYIDSAPWGTCTNLSLKKEILERVGGFDTNFPFRLGGDDTELGIRINKAGYKIKMNPDAVVFHTRETWSKLGAMTEKAFRWGRADFHILKKHPQLGHIAFPSFFTVLLLIALACSSGYIFTGHSDIPVMTIMVWMFSTLLIEAVIKVIIVGEKLRLIFFEFMATLLNLVFDAGIVFESLSRGSLSMFCKRIIYTPALLILEWESEAVRSWSITIGLLLMLIVLWILKGV
jgi:GT2 family glycosyltransferase